MSFGRLRVPDVSSIFRVLRTDASFSNANPLFYLCAFVVVAGLILGEEREAASFQTQSSNY